MNDRIKRLLCRVGFHRWEVRFDQQGILYHGYRRFEACRRCGKERCAR